ncbi:MAG: hypothetical protein HON44_02565 [Glaciecola sp.]|jgi:hypothetical protein|nr:hypothetical protein [Glaciecola sp.]
MKKITALSSTLLILFLLTAQVGNAITGASLFLSTQSPSPCSMDMSDDEHEVMAMHDMSPKMDCCDMPDATTSCCANECECKALSSSFVFLDAHTIITFALVNDAPVIYHELGAIPPHNTLTQRPPITTFS